MKVGHAASWAFLMLFSSMGAPEGVQAQAAEEQYFLDQASQAMPARARRRSDGNAAGALGTQEMRTANSVASALVRRRMSRSRPRDLALLDAAREAEVIVVRGEFDRVQDVLTALEMQHVVLPPRLVGRLPLMSTQTVMVNCPGNVGRRGVEKLRRFVETGGFLVTTDWALRLAGRAFPETIRRSGRETGNDVVPVEVVGDDHPFMEHVQATDDTLRWWLESSSYPIRVIDTRRVEVLLSSETMRRRYGQAAIAVTFPAGEGRVLHTTSHFYLQQSRLTSARDRARGSAFARDLGLDDRDMNELRSQGLDDVRVGQVAGAFAMQQLISNVLVTKRRENDLLLGRFQLRATGEGTLRDEPGADDVSDDEAVSIKVGFLLRELDRRDGWVRVRDLFGREGWVEASLVHDTAAPVAGPAAPGGVPSSTTVAVLDAASEQSPSTVASTGATTAAVTRREALGRAPSAVDGGCSVGTVPGAGTVPLCLAALVLGVRRRRH
ncbi:MAG: hypothetical protein JRH11_02890 [Deltaproteobacteria bacterium]|nr:hypothetical protein [Deltaproteobacteria bacterium]